MAKAAVSVTLDRDNLRWLEGHQRATGARSLSQTLDDLVTAARRAAGAAGPARSVVGTLTIAADDPDLTTADALVRRAVCHVAGPAARCGPRRRARAARDAAEAAPWLTPPRPSRIRTPSFHAAGGVRLGARARAHFNDAEAAPPSSMSLRWLSGSARCSCAPAASRYGVHSARVRERPVQQSRVPRRLDHRRSRRRRGTDLVSPAIPSTRSSSRWLVNSSSRCSRATARSRTRASSRRSGRPRAIVVL